MKTSRSRKILVVILAAIVCACISGIGVYKILTPQRTVVYIFNDSYAAGTQVTEGMLTPIEVDSSVVTASGNASTGDYLITSSNYQNVITSAGCLRNDVYRGNIFTSAMLSTTGGNRLEMVMKKNAVAVTVGVNNITGITSGLSYGSRVNIYANYNESTVLILQNVRVLGVGFENGALANVTMEVDTEESLKLIHAYNYGSIHLGLVDANGYQYSPNNSSYNLSGFSN